MSKEHHKHHKAEGVKLAGSPEKLIDLMIKSNTERKWATEQLVNEGPKHKQVLSALLIQRLYKLVKSIEKTSGFPFELQEGIFLTSEKGENGVSIPIATPIKLSAGFDKKKVAKAISHSPEHEVLAYTMCLQVIEWAINLAKKPEPEIAPIK